MRNLRTAERGKILIFKAAGGGNLALSVYIFRFIHFPPLNRRYVSVSRVI